MKLFEVLDRTIQYKWLTQGRELSMAEFEVGGKIIRVEFHFMQQGQPEEYDPSAPKSTIDISFNTRPIRGASEYYDEDEEPDYKITGGGSEYEIFATVMRIVFEYVKKNKPNAISFTADDDEPSRVKLYDRFVKRFTASGYKLWKREAAHQGVMWILKKS